MSSISLNSTLQVEIVNFKAAGCEILAKNAKHVLCNILETNNQINAKPTEHMSWPEFFKCTFN